MPRGDEICFEAPEINMASEYVQNFNKKIPFFYQLKTIFEKFKSKISEIISSFVLFNCIKINDIFLALFWTPVSQSSLSLSLSMFPSREAASAPEQ